MEKQRLNQKEIKSLLLNILIEFDKFCNKNNLTYYLCGGTLLGAIRHEGFIPWDDDIDIMMPRPDYDRLLDWNDEYGWAGYLKKVDWKHRNLPYPFIKIIDTRTLVEERYLADDLAAKSLWIDVFPIDGNSEINKKNKRLYRGSAFLRTILKLRLAKTNEGTTKVKRILKKVICPLISRIDIYNLCNKIDKWSRQYDFETASKIGGVLWGYGLREMMIDKSGFLKCQKVFFEGYEFNAPRNYEEYLTNLYNDYMRLPPENKRVTHMYNAYMIDSNKCEKRI